MFRRSLLAVALLAGSAPVFATTYTLDPNHTQVQFIWNHYGFTNLTGQFGKIEGTLEFDAADPTKSSVNATISIDSVDSNVKKLDGELARRRLFRCGEVSDRDLQEHARREGRDAGPSQGDGRSHVHGVTKPADARRHGGQGRRSADAQGAGRRIRRDDDDQALGFRHHEIPADGQPTK